MSDMSVSIAYWVLTIEWLTNVTDYSEFTVMISDKDSKN